MIRSATQVTAEVLEAGRELVVVGRAGIGLDNVDTQAATRLGVMVVNAPQSNILSAAEHTIALLLAQARNIPQAHQALVAGRWERSKWEGVELHGKTLGIVGLGRVGALVAQRALAFGMRLCAYDPYVSADRARHMNVEMLTLEELVQEADFITVHLPKTPETVGLIGQGSARPRQAGAADNEHRARRDHRRGRTCRCDHDRATSKVPASTCSLPSPQPSRRCSSFPSVVVTPHLGASTVEAQDKAGVTIGEMVVLALAGDFVPFAVNVAAAEVSETVRPFMPLAEQLGRIFACLNDGLPDKLEVEYQGGLGERRSPPSSPCRC